MVYSSYLSFSIWLPISSSYFRSSLLESVRLLYQGMLRTLLVLLHDFPEFLSDYHLSFCDVIPPSCIQLRNLVLAAFPRSMRLPDPFTPNLKVKMGRNLLGCIWRIGFLGVSLVCCMFVCNLLWRSVMLTRSLRNTGSIVLR